MLQKLTGSEEVKSASSLVTCIYQFSIKSFPISTLFLRFWICNYSLNNLRLSRELKFLVTSMLHIISGSYDYATEPFGMTDTKNIRELFNMRHYKCCDDFPQEPLSGKL